MTLPTAPRSLLRSAEVAAVPFAVSSPSAAVEWLFQAIQQRAAVSVRFANAYSVVSAHADGAYLDLMRRTGVSFPDGAPVAWALRHLAAEPGAQRVRGPSFFSDALARSAASGVGHFFLGTTESTLQQLERSVAARWEGLRIVGTYAPPFRAVDADFVDDCVRRIAEARPDCVWVALGTPKQDLLSEQLAQRLGVPCVAVGAAFDFLAGTKREAPVWMQRNGLEWMYRFAAEPGRLWRRYLLGNLQFIRLVTRHRTR